MRTIFFLVRKEFLQVFRDKATVFQIFFIPVVQLLILSNAATFDVPRAPMAVVDADRSAASGRLIARLEGSGRFRLVATAGSDAAVEAALLDRDANIILRVPEGFGRELSAGRRPTVHLTLNAEDGATAGILQASATAIITQEGADPRAVQRLDLRTSGWFNPSRNYKHYMVPGLLVSLTSIIGLLLTAQNIVREKELGTIEQLNVTPITKLQFIAGKLLPFWILSMVIFTIGMTVAVFVFNVPTRGSVPLVFASAMIYLVVALGIGLFISTITHTQQQTMFVSFFLLLLYLLLSGLFTPLDSVPVWAKWIAQANPVKHFVYIMRTVLVRGGGLAEVWPTLAGLAVAGVAVMSLAVRRYSKQVG